MPRLRYWLLAACLVLAASPAGAFTPQTIVIDGVNDFDSSNLLQDDGIDTQTFCTPPALPLDLGKVYITNDASFLYIGIEFARTCFCDMNLGLAIDVNTPAGGTSDAFGRAIGWTNLLSKPDFYLYDVVPTNCNSFNYEVLYQWNTGTTAWDNISTQVNPSWGSGSNGLGIGDGNTFKEIKLPLSVLGLSTGSLMNLEVWVTQEGSTKGPLDALCSDNVQMSRVGQTTFDTTATVQMTCMLPFTILNAVDATPPTVSSAVAADFQILLDKTFALTTNKVDVVFSEPVDETTAENVSNYAFSGPSPRTVTSAVRDAGAFNVVRLTLNNGIGAAASFFDITVTGVQDLAGNPIVANGNTNVGSFFIQNVTFNADVTLQQCSGAFGVDDTIQVLGNTSPLGFSLCDKAFMFDDEPDGIYTLDVPFALPKDPLTGLAERALEWKLNHNCSEYEPFAGNRTYTLSSTNGASVTLNVAWGNANPADYIDQAVQVVFRVDASSFNPTGTDVITLLGNVAPLAFTQPGVPMLDNGVAPDAAAGDGIYTASVVFPVCSFRNVEWKVDFNGVIECLGQGNRTFTIDDVAYNATGTPQVLPARGIDRCQVTDKSVAVTFTVDMRFLTPIPGAGDSVAVMGDQAPLSFTLPPLAGQLMADDGAAPDAVAGDRIYARTVTFPDSTPLNLGFKYWFNRWPTNGGFECEGFGNRTIRIDDVAYSAGTPQVLLESAWNFCTQIVGVGPHPDPVADGGAAFATLRPAFPVPFSNRTTIGFDLKRSGTVSLRIYDVSGRRLATLIDKALPAGPQSVVWDGRDQSGARVRSGIYLVELSMGSERIGGRLVVTR
jgi:hypothetical protein